MLLDKQKILIKLDRQGPKRIKQLSRDNSMKQFFFFLKYRNKNVGQAKKK